MCRATNPELAALRRRPHSITNVRPPPDRVAERGGDCGKVRGHVGVTPAAQNHRAIGDRGGRGCWSIATGMGSSIRPKDFARPLRTSA
jgi:hypothetical protein